MANESDYYIYDNIAGHVHKPYAIREYKWQEYRKEKIIIKTNNMGFREDADTLRIKPLNTIRILVTGDSHVDGVLDNSESFPNQLEKLLNKESKDSHFEVINGGTGYYGPHNYYGFLKKFLYLHPDIFIVTVYLGNDFLDAVEFAYIEYGGNIPHSSDETIASLVSVGKLIGDGYVWQSLNQVVYFKNFSSVKNLAVEIVEQQFKDINNLCRKNKIELFVVLLPSKLDVEKALDDKLFDRIETNLGLSRQDMNINQQLKRVLSDWFDENKIKYLDMTCYMDGVEGLFWQKDAHLSVKGNRLVSEILYSKIPAVYIENHGPVIGGER
ncbi:MAG: hypothetical protein ABIH18_08670 [Candidatus Omnitrophota bacterium]